MAKYVPPGIEYIPTNTEITGIMKVVGDENINLFRGAFYENRPLSLRNNKMVITSVEEMQRTHWRNEVLVKFHVTEDVPLKLFDDLVIYGEEIVVNQKQNYNTYEHNGYIKRDVTKQHTADETHVVRLWDIPRDKDGNEWEVSVLENRPYYCCDCNDMHDSSEPTATYLFRFREDAEYKYAELIP